MIKANEARKKVEDNLKNSLTKELQNLEVLINNAIEDGQCQVFINGTLRTETENQLIKLGYKVEVGGRYNERETVVRW